MEIRVIKQYFTCYLGLILKVTAAKSISCQPCADIHLFDAAKIETIFDTTKPFPHNPAVPCQNLTFPLTLSLPLAIP